MSKENHVTLIDSQVYWYNVDIAIVLGDIFLLRMPKFNGLRIIGHSAIALCSYSNVFDYEDS